MPKNRRKYQTWDSDENDICKLEYITVLFSGIIVFYNGKQDIKKCTW